MRALIVLSLMLAPAAAQEDSWKTEVDNNLVRVSRRFLAPHGAVSADDMPASLFVFFSDYSVRIAGAGRQAELQGKPFEVVWHPGGQVGIENLGGLRLEVVQVSPKYTPEPSYELSAAKPDRVKFLNDLLGFQNEDI